MWLDYLLSWLGEEAAYLALAPVFRCMSGESLVPLRYTVQAPPELPMATQRASLGVDEPLRTLRRFRYGDCFPGAYNHSKIKENFWKLVRKAQAERDFSIVPTDDAPVPATGVEVQPELSF